MIVGVFIQNFKCYKGLHYIPLTNADGSNFCGLIGLNGVGKSAVLEALDCVFNDKEMIRNSDADSDTYIIPICTLDTIFWNRCRYGMETKDFYTYKNCRVFGESLSQRLKNMICDDCISTISPEHREAWQCFKKCCEMLTFDNQLLLPLVTSHSDYRFHRTTHYVIYSFLEDILGKELTDIRETIAEYVYYITLYAKHCVYVYIPKNIYSEDFKILETIAIQRLLCIDLIKKIPELVSDINKPFRDFVRNFKEDYGNLNINFKSKEDSFLDNEQLSKYLLHTLFSNFTIVKEMDGTSIPLSQLSSGEKQHTIIELIYHVICKSKNVNLIIAIDEPESSFHLSERFEQFNKLYEISQNCGQVLFASHWYGFIPSIPNGCVVNIANDSERRSISILDIYKYKEEAVRLPVDISLKGNSDLIQTILSSILIEKCYNWLICEGTSDKIYLEEYLKEEIRDLKLRIIPIGGCSHIRKIFTSLVLNLLDLKSYDNIEGKIFLLVDTDEITDEKEREKIYKDPESAEDVKKFIRGGRLLNICEAQKTLLVNLGHQNKIKGKYKEQLPTDIEGVLNGKAFNRVLNAVKLKYADDEAVKYLDFIDSEDKTENPSFFALNLLDEKTQKGNENYKKLRQFFKTNKWDNKVAFARAYVEEIQKGGYKEPSWITEIKKFFRA